MSGQQHFDAEPTLDPVNGYPERDLLWFSNQILPDFLGVVESNRLSGDLLDVGCASGYFTRMYAQSFPRPHGIDLSPVRIDKAREIHGTDATFDVCDITKEHPVRTFDVAISSAVFQHIAPSLRAQAFQNVHDSLKPGGVLILYDAIYDLQPGATAWDGYTEFLTIQRLCGMSSFRVIGGPTFIAVDGGGYRIHRVVLQALA